MNSHLAIKINGRYIALLPDTSIDIEDTNPYFNDVEETWSYSFSVPIDGNRETFGNVDTIESDKRLADIEDLPMSVEVDGISYRNGRVRASEDQEVRDNIDISMSSSVKSLAEYFQDKNCRDIPVKDKIQIGEILGDLRMYYSCYTQLIVTSAQRTLASNGWHSVDKVYFSGVNNVISQTVSFPALGFSRPDSCKESSKDQGYVSTGDIGKEPEIEETFINITEPYPAKKYCNARISYLHHKKKEDGTSSDDVDTESGKDNSKKYNPYYVLDANRPASGICFYVLYFLDCLFDSIKDDGVYYDNSELVKIQDMCRLAFYTTHCCFDVMYKFSDTGTGYLLSDLKNVVVYAKKKHLLTNMNKWLSSRNINTSLEVELKTDETEIEGSVVIDGKEYKKGMYSVENGIESQIQSIKYGVSHLEIQSISANILKMYANEQNFPDTDVMSIIENLWAAFGIKFFIDQEQRIVKPVFIRDILRAASMPENLYGTVSDVIRFNEKITGVRMKYGAESDRQQQQDNVKYGVTDYDTSFDYIDYSRIVSSLQYGDILRLVHDSNRNLYVDKSTGNKYRVKIDGDAETRKEFHPVLFEVGQYKGVEIGNCSKENEDYIEEITVGFDPVLFNDVNGRNAKKAFSGDQSIDMIDSDGGSKVSVSLLSSSDKQQVLSGFISDDMWHENIPREIIYPMGSSYVNLSLKAKITTEEAFDPSSSSTGDSPLQSYDWGTSIAIMRGGGSDATIEYYDEDYDGFGNSKWRTVAGQYTMSSDSIDAWGSVYDYQPGNGIGSEDGRFSLKIRAYINDPVTGEPLCDNKVANRGLFDTFMSEYAYFLLHRKVVRLKYHGNITDLINIKWDRRYTIGGYTGWINKISTHITAANGIEECTIEMYIL